jgi:hypothetical protein
MNFIEELNGINPKVKLKFLLVLLMEHSQCLYNSERHYMQYWNDGARKSASRHHSSINKIQDEILKMFEEKIKEINNVDKKIEYVKNIENKIKEGKEDAK